jgi:hypothetical protein
MKAHPAHDGPPPPVPGPAPEALEPSAPGTEPRTLHGCVTMAEVDGVPGRARLRGTLDQLAKGEPLRFEGCGGARRLGPGDQAVRGDRCAGRAGQHQPLDVDGSHAAAPSLGHAGGPYLTMQPATDPGTETST